jgi:hypothetical protein
MVSVRLAGVAALEGGSMVSVGPTFLRSALPVVRFGVDMASRGALRVILRQRNLRFGAVLVLVSALAAVFSGVVVVARGVALLSGNLLGESTRLSGTWGGVVMRSSLIGSWFDLIQPVVAADSTISLRNPEVL